MRIARVFPTKTSHSPTDQDCYFGLPDLFTPRYEVVHISVTFTWDMEKARILFENWRGRTDHIEIGGPAIQGTEIGEFNPGLYMKHGYVITSRGCPNKCEHCFVPEREGKIKELDVKEGNIICDNNIIACSDSHLQKVFSMLKKQKSIEFKGGLEGRRITPKIADELRSLRIKSLWLASDYRGSEKTLRNAVEILTKAGFKRSHLYCYVLIGDDMVENEERLREVFNIGCMPFAQLYQPKSGYVEYKKEWKQFVRKWSRPAIIRSVMKVVEDQ